MLHPSRCALRQSSLFAVTSLVVLFAALPLRSLAQDSFRFAGVPWGSNAESVKKIMAESGFKFEKADDADLAFTGTVLDYDSVVWAYMSKSDGLVKITISLLTPDQKAISVYRDTRASLIKLYGPSKDSFEYFEPPYEKGDGYEEQAIRVGKGHFSTYWEGQPAPGSDYPSALSVKITERLTVMISYEASAWGKEADKRKAQATSILKKH